MIQFLLKTIVGAWVFLCFHAFGLNIAPFVEERAKYGQIPKTIEECERYQSPHPTES